MANLNKWVRSVALVGAASLALAACGGNSGTSSTSSSASSPAASSSSAAPSAGQAGGTLYYLQNYPFESTDPTRIYYGLELANFRRLFYRTLVSFPDSADPAVATKAVPDLATDTGTTPDGGKTWSFTLKDGIMWQDGSPITCQDFKYGASRVFATDVLTGGPNYMLSYLDIPTDKKTGLPVYDGPYKGDGQKYYDKAVTCDGNTITYRFNKPWPDFPLAVAMLMTTDPYKQSFDKGPKSQWLILSNGPYEIQGSNTWDKNTGATLVRNPNFTASTMDPSLGSALPDQIDYQINNSPDASNTITDRLIADAGKDACAITNANIPPAYFTQVQDPPISDRTVNVVSPYTFYLVPNFDKMTNPLVRQALAEATNKDAYIKAIGGAKSASPADSIINPGVAGYQPNPAFADIPTAGDTQKAHDLLVQAGVKLPYPITYTYHAGTTADKAAAALKETWDAAGFNVTLDGLTDTYYDVISKPNKKSDVMLAGWGADWPSAMTVLPPLFDSRPNITQNSYGQDYGGYKSPAFNKLVDQAGSASSIDQMNQTLQQADALLGTDVAYIPVYNLNFYFIWGSAVTGFTPTASSSMNPDLGLIGVDPSKCS